MKKTLPTSSLKFLSVNTSKNLSVNTSKNLSVNTSKNLSVNTSKNLSVNTSKNLSVNTSKNLSVNLFKLEGLAVRLKSQAEALRREKIQRTFESTKGFTLIELMIVVVVIAILAVIGITVFGNVQKSARDARRKADIDAIGQSTEAYYSNNNLTSYVMPPNSQFATGAPPVDPTNNNTYKYFYNGITVPAANSSLTNWVFCAYLEGGNGNAGGGSVPNSSSAFNIAATAGSAAYYYCRSGQQ